MLRLVFTQSWRVSLSFVSSLGKQANAYSAEDVSAPAPIRAMHWGGRWHCALVDLYKYKHTA